MTFKRKKSKTKSQHRENSKFPKVDNIILTILPPEQFNERSLCAFTYVFSPHGLYCIGFLCWALLLEKMFGPTEAVFIEVGPEEICKGHYLK